jgi:CubicO group peptidase (beta-lactamase class C family)
MTEQRLQAKIQAALDRAVATGAEVGSQVAVIKNGQVVADVVSGIADPQTGVEVSAGTLFWAASTAKGVASSVAHILVERGELDYDMRVVDVWPEFGAHGKDKVTLRHVLLHTAGVPGLPPDVTIEDLCDWDHMCAVLADEKPWWEPGAAFGYHAKTFGYLLGETVRRATGSTMSAVLRETVTGPLGIEGEVHFGVPQPLLPRVARQVAGGTATKPPEPGTPLDRAMPRGIVPDAGYANRADVLTSDIPSDGTMTARGVARIYSALLGHADGVSLVSPARLATMAAVAFTGLDQVMGFDSAWAFGYSPNRPGGVASRPGSTFGMVGMNGSSAYADIDSGVAVAVMRNRFGGDLTTVAMIDRIVAETPS